MFSAGNTNVATWPRLYSMVLKHSKRTTIHESRHPLCRQFENSRPLLAIRDMRTSPVRVTFQRVRCHNFGNYNTAVVKKTRATLVAICACPLQSYFEKQFDKIKSLRTTVHVACLIQKFESR